MVGVVRLEKPVHLVNSRGHTCLANSFFIINGADDVLSSLRQSHPL